MAPAREERRIIAILFADIVGFSHLVEVDEVRTIKQQRRHRAETIEPKIEEFHGRLVKTTGDGFLAEFASVVDAVECAIAIQQALIEREADNAPERKIWYRMGINLGDVIIDDNDILGDAVNIASRLEQLAQPGGLCISGTAFDQLKHKVDVDCEDLGEVQVKNIDAPVRAYRVVVGQEPSGRAVRGTRQPLWSWQRPRLLVVIAATLLIAGAGSYWFLPWVSSVGSSRTEDVATSTSDRPTIVVLPFDNLSNDPDQELFVDGITADLITDFSKIAGIAVIGRNSSFVYKGQAVDARALAVELGVTYVLEGSVRRAGDQLRFNTRLIDARSGEQIWAERFDETVDSIFLLQDRVTRRVIGSLAVTLSAVEDQQLALKETASIEAYEAFLRGWGHYRRFTQEDFVVARDYFENAIEFDPAYGRAYAALALVHHRAFELGWARALGMGWNIARLKAGEFLRRAWDNPTPLAHRVASEIYLQAGRTDESLEQARQAVGLEPSDPENYFAEARSLVFLGREDEAISKIENAMSLEVHYPAEYLYVRGLAYFGLEQYGKALSDFKESMARNPDNHRIQAALAATYAYLDRQQEAKTAFTDYWDSETSPSHYGRWSSGALREKWPYKHQADFERFTGGLAKAGERTLQPQ